MVRAPQGRVVTCRLHYVVVQPDIGFNPSQHRSRMLNFLGNHRCLTALLWRSPVASQGENKLFQAPVTSMVQSFSHCGDPRRNFTTVEVLSLSGYYPSSADGSFAGSDRPLRFRDKLYARSKGMVALPTAPGTREDK